MDIPAYHLFATDLWDSFDNIVKYTANEIQFCKDLTKFLRKRISIEEEYSKQLAKLAEKSEYAKPSTGTLSNAWENVLYTTSTQASNSKTLATRLTEKTLNTLTVLIKDLENKKKQLFDEGERINSAKAKQIESLDRAKKEYEKCSKEAETAELLYQKKNADPNSKPKDLQNLENDMQKKKQKAQQTKQEYQKKVSETNSMLEDYYSNKMPKVMSEFEKLTHVRIHMTKTNLRRYLQVLEEAPPQQVKLLESLQKEVEKISESSDIDEIVREYKTGLTIPPPFEFQEYVQGKLQPPTNRIEKFKGFIRAAVSTESVELPPAPVKETELGDVFGRSLEVLMERQKDSPLPVPRILDELVSRIRLEQKLEGMFRISAAQTVLLECKEKIDKKDYDFLDAVDLHVYCSLLKLWLRSLPDPLIPDQLNNSQVEDSNHALSVFNSLPPINQKVIKVLVDLIADLLPESVVNVTRMGLDNYAMIFSQSFLRCTSTDPVVIMGAPEKQKQFVKALVIAFFPSAANNANVSSSSLSATLKPETPSSPSLAKKNPPTVSTETPKVSSPPVPRAVETEDPKPSSSALELPTKPSVQAPVFTQVKPTSLKEPPARRARPPSQNMRGVPMIGAHPRPMPNTPPRPNQEIIKDPEEAPNQ